MKEAIRLFSFKAALGEGAIWDHRTRKYLWVDIEKGNIYIYNPEEEVVRSIAVGQRIGTLVPTTQDQIIVAALQDGLYSVDLTTERINLLIKAPYPTEEIRFNDGKCDPSGRFWVGTMSLQGLMNKAALYRYEYGEDFRVMIEPVSTSNGICWSADNQTMYYIDTPQQRVMAYDFDNSTGVITNGHIIIDMHEIEGSPDGMTIDSEGKLWIALWGGASVVRYDPDSGDLLERILVPAKNVTSCTFGGKNLEQLLITTASIGMSEKDHQLYPEAGSIFIATPGVNGVENNYFNW